MDYEVFYNLKLRTPSMAKEIAHCQTIPIQAKLVIIFKKLTK